MSTCVVVQIQRWVESRLGVFFYVSLQALGVNRRAVLCTSAVLVGDGGQAAGIVIKRRVTTLQMRVGDVAKDREIVLHSMLR